MNTVYQETLPAKTATLIDLFSQNHPDFLSTFYLSGGTALSLQLGHRESEDLDFFSKQPFRPELVEQQLHAFGALQDTTLASGTLNTYLNGVKLQFLEYPYPLLEPPMSWNGIEISSVVDIACTKLQTVGMRGSKKDFVDLYFLLDLYSLDQLFSFARTKYIESDYSETHILKSLVYFEDAESQPMPRLHKEVSWDHVKKRMIDAVKLSEII